MRTTLLKIANTTTRPLTRELLYQRCDHLELTDSAIKIKQLINKDILLGLFNHKFSASPRAQRLIEVNDQAIIRNLALSDENNY